METEKGTLMITKTYFQWKIKRFFADWQKVDYYKSPFFPIQYSNQLTKWYLLVYPNGDKEQSKDYVSLYLKSETKIEVTVDFHLSIRNEPANLSSRSKATTTFTNQGFNSWGWTKFRKHCELRNAQNKALVDDTLTILCQLTIHEPTQADIESFDGYNKWIDKIGNGFGDYEDILENGRFTDGTFNVQDKQINLHKDILSCRSPVFKAMFEHDMRENKQNSVDVTDIDYDIMKELFRFLYSGKVQNIDKIAGGLLIAADKYATMELKALCEKVLYDKLTVDNAIEYLKLTEMCDTIHLKLLIIKFVADHYKDVAKKPDFVDLNSSVMQRIILAIAERN